MNMDGQDRQDQADEKATAKSWLTVPLPNLP